MQQLPQVERDFVVGFATDTFHGPFLLSSAAYRIRLLLVRGDNSYWLRISIYIEVCIRVDVTFSRDLEYYAGCNDNPPIDKLIDSGIVDHLVECCRNRSRRGLRVSRISDYLIHNNHYCFSDFPLIFLERSCNDFTSIHFSWNTSTTTGNG